MRNGEPSAYKVRLRNKRVKHELDKLQETDHHRVSARLESLAVTPRPPGCEKLYDDVYRVRVWDMRIIYLIDETNKRIEIGGIRRRSEKTYKRIEDLFQ